MVQLIAALAFLFTLHARPSLERTPSSAEELQALYITMLGTNSGGVFFARISSATLRTRAQGAPKAAPVFAERMVLTMRLLFRADRALAVDPEVTPTR
jgi:hypothetical protein